VRRFNVQLLPAAEAEVAAAFDWYVRRSPLAAAAFKAEIIGAIDRLERNAEVWAADGDGLRRCMLRRFPYTVHYELVDTLVTVLAVAHQRRRPGYWRSV
jgi:plasmid stabilization system protein ParE